MCTIQIHEYACTILKYDTKLCVQYALWQIFDCVLGQHLEGHRKCWFTEAPIAINISWCIEHARGTFVCVSSVAHRFSMYLNKDGFPETTHAHQTTAHTHTLYTACIVNFQVGEHWDSVELNNKFPENLRNITSCCILNRICQNENDMKHILCKKHFNLKF